MRRILVTAVSGDIGNGILKVLQETSDELYGCDVNQYAAGMDKVRRFFVVPPAQDDDYIRAIGRICEENHITHVLPANEREIERLSRDRAVFVDKGIRLMVHEARILETCLDKYHCMMFLREHGIRVPDTKLASEGRLPQGDRYILKPRRSNGSKGIQMIQALTDEEISEEYIVQSYIPGDEYTIGVFSDGDTVSTITFRRKLKNGYSDYVELVQRVELAVLAERISRALHIQGYINIQLREWEGRQYVFEINPRISGTVYFRHMLGFQDVLWWLAMLDGERVPRYLCSYEQAVGLRELKEKFVDLRRKQNV